MGQAVTKLAFCFSPPTAPDIQNVFNRALKRVGSEQHAWQMVQSRPDWLISLCTLWDMEKTQLHVFI